MNKNQNFDNENKFNNWKNKYNKLIINTNVIFFYFYSHVFQNNIKFLVIMNYKIVNIDNLQ